MNTQDKTNLAVEYLEVVTCTYKELCAIKTPTNGRLYHTSDTNEFYFDWNNKRHKLSVFSSSKSETSDVVKKSELSSWLAENNYITNLSLTEELINIIGSPIENIITKQALDNYSRNYLVTKEELSLLNEPLNLIESVTGLQNTDRTLYSYCDRLASQINEVRTVANSKLSSGELDTKLNEYLKKSFADSLYISKDDANALFIDKEEFAEKIQDYITREQLTESLQPYQKKSEADGKYATKSELTDKYLQKSAANRTYVTKTDANRTFETKEGVNEKLNDYVKKSETSEFAKKSEVESSFAKKSDLNKYETKTGVNEKLSSFAVKTWVDEYYMSKDKVKKELNKYASKEYVSEKLSDYESKSDIDEKLNDYLTKSQAEDVYAKKSTLNKYAKLDYVNDAFSTFAKGIWVEQNYMRKFKLSDYMKSDDIYDIFIKKSAADEKYLSKTDAENTYAKITDIIDKSTDNFVTKDEAQSFAKKLWVDEYYMRKGQFDGIKNAMVLSREFATEDEIREVQRNIMQGFYYLTTDEKMMVAISDGTDSGNKIFIDITNLQTDFSLYFGGDDVNW